MQRLAADLDNIDPFPPAVLVLQEIKKDEKDLPETFGVEENADGKRRIRLKKLPQCS